jgi:hypothetical protein
MRLVLALCGVLAVATAASPPPARRYGDFLLERIGQAHPGVEAISVTALAKDGSPISISRGRARHGHEETSPLVNSMGERIGTFTIAFAHARHAPASAIGSDLSRAIYLADNLVEPDPFVAGARRSAKGQAIIERMMVAYPDLVTLAFHVGLSGAQNAILASNFGRIGKPGDKDDAKVIDQGAILREPTNGGRRLAVSLPLLDTHGRTVGALSTSFRVGAGGNEEAYRRALLVRDAIARQVRSISDVSN